MNHWHRGPALRGSAESARLYLHEPPEHEPEPGPAPIGDPPMPAPYQPEPLDLPPQTPPEAPPRMNAQRSVVARMHDYFR